jgi:hypothetical protein
MAFKAIEYLACQFIDIQNLNPIEAVTNAIELSLTKNRFINSYEEVKELVG